MSNYDRGANFERRCQKRLEKEGWFVIRSAGSHSLIDLAAFKGGEVILVQCKTDGKLSINEREQLKELARMTCCQVFMLSRQGNKMISEGIKEESRGK